MNPFIIIAITILGFSGPILAKTLIGSKVAVETSKMKEWLADFESTTMAQKDKLGITECREVSELKGSVLCSHDTQETMNKALTRATMFIEGSAGEKDKVYSLAGGTYGFYADAFGGHDLRSQDLERFYQAVEKKCQDTQNDADYCLSPIEEEFFKTVVNPLMQKKKPFVVITFAIYNVISVAEVVTHEILHAQYFLDKKYQQITDMFWQSSVPAGDKKKIVKVLSRFYDSSSDQLMGNEFQAYMLMTGAEKNLLGSFVRSYQQKLLALLSAKGIQPLQVDL